MKKTILSASLIAIKVVIRIAILLVLLIGVWAAVENQLDPNKSNLFFIQVAPIIIFVIAIILLLGNLIFKMFHPTEIWCLLIASVVMILLVSSTLFEIREKGMITISTAVIYAIFLVTKSMMAFIQAILSNKNKRGGTS